MGKIHLPSGFVVLKNQRMMFPFMSHYKVKVALLGSDVRAVWVRQDGSGIGSTGSS